MFFKILDKRRGGGVGVGMTDEVVAPFIAVGVVEEARAGRVEAKKPRECVLALEMLAEGKGYEEVSEATGLGFSAIRALKGRHALGLEERKLQLATEGFEMAEGMRLLIAKKQAMLADDEDALKKTSLKDLAISYAIATDKGVQAMEGNRVVVEHRGSKPTLAQAMKAIEEARAAIKKVEPEEAVDV